jgi:hypothetical protein
MLYTSVRRGMAQETAAVPDLTQEEITARVGMIKKMLMVGGLFVAVGYLLVGSALFFELTQFHPLLDSFFATQTQHSLAGGGPDRAGGVALNAQLATIHQWPSTLLWLKLGGVAHILTGIFIALAAIVRALSMMPDRLGSMMMNQQSASSTDVAPADD